MYKLNKILPKEFMYYICIVKINFSIWLNSIGSCNFLHIGKRESRAYDVQDNYKKTNLGNFFWII